MQVHSLRTAMRLAIMAALVFVVACGLVAPGIQTRSYASASPLSWREVPVALPSNGAIASSTLNSISALSGAEMWAVGSVVQQGTTYPLVERWDGTAWHYIATPAAAAAHENGALYAVHARATGDIWAVGTADRHSSNLIMHWDGQRWTSNFNLQRSIFANELHGVISFSADDAWAVGYAGQPTPGFEAMAFHWDGTRWQPRNPPRSGYHNDYLYAITGLSSNDVWALGYSTDYRGNTTNLYAAHWDGGAWSLMPPTDGPIQARLYSAVEIASGQLFAVGHYGPDDAGPSAVLHYFGKLWSSDLVQAHKDCRASLRAVAGNSQSNLWTGGAMSCTAGKQRTALHRSDAGWAARPFGRPVKGDSHVLGMTLADDQIWVVGYADGAFAAYYPLDSGQ